MTMMIKQGAPVVTADGQRLGLAARLFTREEEANPALKLYATYLQVRNWELGAQFYVPLEFVEGIDAIGESVNLLLTERQIEEATYNRLPQFVASGRVQVTDLS